MVANDWNSSQSNLYKINKLEKIHKKIKGGANVLVEVMKQMLPPAFLLFLTLSFDFSPEKNNFLADFSLMTAKDDS